MFHDENLAPSISLPTFLTTTRPASTITYDDTIQNLSRTYSPSYLMMRDESSRSFTQWPLTGAAGVIVPALAKLHVSQIVVVALGMALLALLVRAIIAVWIYPFYTSPLRKLPGPTDNAFLLGQMRRYLEVDWVPFLYLQWLRLWPDAPFIRFLGIGNSETLLASNINSYREILVTKNNHFVKPTVSRSAANVVIGDGLPFAEGHAHRGKRAILNRPFAANKVRAFVPTIQEKARQLADVVEAKRDHRGEVEIETSCWQAVLDIIGIEVLGRDYNHVEDENAPFYRIFGKTMQQSLSGHLIHFFNSYFPVRRMLQPFNLNNDFLESCDEARGLIRKDVNQRRLDWSRRTKTGENTELSDDVLQVMIQDPSMSDEEVTEYALNFMVLGHDTTACTLVWSLYVLSREMEAQSRLRAEIQEMLTNAPDPTYADIEGCVYLERFINEVLRIYCPVAYIPRQATEDVEIAGVHIPKGTVINLSPAMMNLNHRIWGDDVMEFRPDRWTELQGDAATVYAFESFHNGPRHCIGRRLSMMELRIFLIELVSRFHITSLGRGDVTKYASPSFTLRPEEKLRVRLQPLEEQVE